MRVSTLASIAGLAMIAAAAPAQIFISSGPGHLTGTENVLFNDSSQQHDGTLVQGSTNRTHTSVDFFSTTELHSGGGQAKITAYNKGDTFSDLTMSLTDSSKSITSLVFSFDAVDNGSVTFNIGYNGGTWSQTFDVKKNGQNWFAIQADSGFSMSSINWVSDVGIKDVKHVRLGAVPEPATMLGLGLGAAALIRRRKKAAN